MSVRVRPAAHFTQISVYNEFMPHILLYGLIFLFITLLMTIIVLFIKNLRVMSAPKLVEARYVALGDSYPLGEGAGRDFSWPNVLTKHLQQKGVAISLIENPSVLGATTQEVIEDELPSYEASNPTFASLQIGVNDWIHGTTKQLFKENLETIITRMQAKLSNPHRIVLVTIPDFSVTPNGAKYAGERNAVMGIQGFNQVIKDLATEKGLVVVDIYPLSQGMKEHQELTAADGIHPSAQEYALWEGLILPSVLQMLQT